MKTIVVIFGGRSTEHEISMRSARNVINALDRTKYRVFALYVDKQGRLVSLGEQTTPVEDWAPDCLKTKQTRCASIATFAQWVDSVDDLLAFPLIHGQTGEDGEWQGFLQTMGIPYVGSRLTASALCMDKGFANRIFRDNGLPKAKFYVLTRHEFEESEPAALADRIFAACGESVFVKPANNGSSIGVTRATRKNLREALELAFRYDLRVVIEEEIIGKELEVSVLGNAEARASLPGSYTATRELLDYTAKYNDKTTVENVPHPLSEEKTRELQALALRAYHALQCEGFARVDIFMDKAGRFFVNEINTSPGMTPTSLASKLWTSLTDLTFPQYLDAIIDYAMEAEAAHRSILTSWGDQ